MGLLKKQNMVEFKCVMRKMQQNYSKIRYTFFSTTTCICFSQFSYFFLLKIDSFWWDILNNILRMLLNLKYVTTVLGYKYFSKTIRTYLYNDRIILSMYEFLFHERRIIHSYRGRKSKSSSFFSYGRMYLLTRMKYYH